MTNLLIDIASYLQLNALVQGYGLDTFVDYLPDAPDTVIGISEYQGAPSQDGAQVANRSVQIVVRATSYDTARAKTWGIYNLLDTPDDRICQLNSSRVCIFHPRQVPFKMRVDKTGRPIWGFNMGVTTIKDI